MTCVLRLADFYLNETKRLLLIEPGLIEERRKAKDLERWIRHCWSEMFVSQRVILRRGPRGTRNLADTQLAIETLVKAGTLEAAGKQLVDGAMTDNAWRLV